MPKESSLDILPNSAKKFFSSYKKNDNQQTKTIDELMKEQQRQNALIASKNEIRSKKRQNIA